MLEEVTNSKSLSVVEDLRKNGMLFFLDLREQIFLVGVGLDGSLIIVGDEGPNPPVHDPDASGVFPKFVPAGVNTFPDPVVDVNSLIEDLHNGEAQVIRNIGITGKHKFRQIREFFEDEIDDGTLDYPHVVGVGLSLIVELLRFAKSATTVQKQLTRRHLHTGLGHGNERRGDLVALVNVINHGGLERRVFKG